MRSIPLQVLQVPSNVEAKIDPRTRPKFPTIRPSGPDAFFRILHNTQRGGQNGEPNKDHRFRDIRPIQDTVFVIPAGYKPLWLPLSTSWRHEWLGTHQEDSAPDIWQLTLESCRP
jgi:hypothetical protein